MSDPRMRGAAAPRPVEVLAVKEGQTHLVRFLAGYSGTDIHWMGERYVPCLGEGLCPAKTHDKRTLWRGWAPVQQWEELTQLWWPMVLEITEKLEEQLRGHALRGSTWAMTRPNVKGKTSPVVGILMDRVEESLFPKPFDIVPVLLRVYRVPVLQLGKANPLPPKLVLPASEGVAPQIWAETVAQPDPAATAEDQAKARKLLRDALEKVGRTPHPSTNGSKGGSNHG